ncbi:MAG TPA: hypothetical protein VIX91_02780 [Candidatus Acidoferrum sp.]
MRRSIGQSNTCRATPELGWYRLQYSFELETESGIPPAARGIVQLGPIITDGFGTQATQNVLEAMISARPPSAEGAAGSEAVLKINGRVLRSVSLPKPQDVVGPVTMLLANDLTKGTHKIELTRSGGEGAMNASVVTS